MKKFKEGAASFYVVAISTLILVIVAASFAGLIVSEITRTSNDDLSQSAYDAALAGVEDAKLAFMNYQDCKKEPGTKFGNDKINCSGLVAMIDTGSGGCDMVANALGREQAKDNDGNEIGVLVQEGTNNDGNAMEQYYTCTTISARTNNYLGTLTAENPQRSSLVKFYEDWGKDSNIQMTGDVADAVDRVRLSWHSFGDNAEKGKNGSYFSFTEVNENGAFGTSDVTPAMMTLTLTQTGPTFDLNDFNISDASGTDRATLYFVPVDKTSYSANAENYISLVEGEGNPNGTGNREVSAEEVIKSNDKTIKNKPFLVLCDKDGAQDYACMVDIRLPKPLGGEKRNKDTFVIDTTASYGAPKTDYQLEFFADSISTSMPVTLDGVQISIDSTGRANDLFRRVDTRLEATDASYPYPRFGVETLQSKATEEIIFGEDVDGKDAGIHKEVVTGCEFNFDDLTCGNP